MDFNNIIRLENHPNATIIHILVGQMHMYHIPDFREKIGLAISEKPSKVIIVLNKVHYLDSSAMGFLFQLKRSILDFGGRLILVGINHTIAMVFKLTKSDEDFEIYDTVQEALDN